MKKGSMHIEIIVSFILFSAFVVFILFYVRPYKETALSDSILLGVQNSFGSETNTNVTRLFLYSNPTPGCFAIPLGVSDQGGFAKTPDGVSVAAYVSSGYLYVNSSGGYFSVILSPELASEGTLSGCSILISENYTVGSLGTEQVISYSKIAELGGKYNNSYSVLRDEMNVPSTFDFAISADDISMQRTIPSESPVFAKTLNHLIIYPDGKLQSKEVIFRAW